MEKYARNFDIVLEPYRGLFARKSAVLEPTLRPNSESRTMLTFHGKYGVIFPHSADGKTLGVDYLGYPHNPELSERKLSALKAKLDPYINEFVRLDGEYQATFPIKNLEQVADTIRVRRRGKQGGHLRALNKRGLKAG